MPEVSASPPFFILPQNSASVFVLMLAEASENCSQLMYLVSPTRLRTRERSRNSVLNW
ncbi:MAG: hypothetical protein HC888_11595 [Candidatus Competibacteraceae bacterium]|nr:hypothetical protein [Candidatus Competibacteraceae bacterium]